MDIARVAQWGGARRAEGRRFLWLLALVGFVGCAAAGAAPRPGRPPNPGASAHPEVVPQLTIVSPSHGDVVPAMLEVRLRAAAISDDIHLLVTDATTPAIYHHVGRIAAPLAGRAETLTRLIDTTGFGDAGTFRLVAISTNRLSVAPGGQVDARAIPSSIPVDDIEVRHAGAILAPVGGERVGAVETVRVQGFLPRTYVAAVVRPVGQGGYWVQNTGILVSPTIPIPLRVHFGGAGVYHLYVGVTSDPELFTEGGYVTRLPEQDRAAKPVYWLGPIEVTHR